MELLLTPNSKSIISLSIVRERNVNRKREQRERKSQTCAECEMQQVTGVVLLVSAADGTAGNLLLFQSRVRSVRRRIKTQSQSD